MNIKIKRCSIAFFVLFFAVKMHAQRYIWSQDSLVQAAPNYAMDRYHDILRFHDPLMYLAYPVIKPIVDRRVPLKDGEGKDGYWLEGNFAYRFAIVQGKYYSYSFIKRTRLTLDVDLLLRLAKDHSSPLLPSNNKI